MTGQAYRTPNRGPAGCGADVVAFAIAAAITAGIIAALGALWGWW